MKIKRYRLKYNLPTFKAGDEFELTPRGALVQVINGRTGVCAYAASTIERFPNILTDWFEEIKPAEPLIKDDGVREAVKAWAIANLIPSNETGIEYLYSETLNGTFTEFRHNELVNIMFYGGKIAPDAIHGRCYTIDELCGEE